MFTLSSVFYISTLLTGTVLAAPTIISRQTTEPCTAVFDPNEAYDWNNSLGLGTSNGAKNGSGIVKINPKANFKFTKVNTSPPSYYIQSWDNRNLAVGMRSNNSLFFTQNKDDGNLKFIIECGTTCSSGLNDGCFMKLADDPKRCVRVGTGDSAASGSAITVVDECVKNDTQRFNYFTVPSPPTPIPPTKPPTTSPPPPTNSSGKVCNPNFEFQGVRVANSAINWGAASFLANTELVGERDFNKRLEIRFEQTGSPNPYYVAKSLNGTNLVIAVRPQYDNLNFVDKLDPNDARQKWEIECKAFCRGASEVAPGDLSADGCTIKSVFDNRCVQLGNGPTAGSQGDRIFVNACDGTDSQRFNFLTSPFKASGHTSSTNELSGAGAKGNVAAALGDSDSVNLDVKQLITNSYIVIGLLVAILVAMMVMGVLASRGCLRGKDSRTRYTVVTGKETEAFTAPNGRYSD
ncbi:hypothetical protein V5O48_008781 [Marasmius crinis-equi]|uniref:Ricin B lectin domain-containing protein n=1 Tax=Marasmius crinis-equi TaxID=585013 RepID=A0ABR3FCY4_9AGAR